MKELTFVSFVGGVATRIIVRRCGNCEPTGVLAALEFCHKIGVDSGTAPEHAVTMNQPKKLDQCDI